MASLGHVAVGLLVGRAHGSHASPKHTAYAMAAFAGLALLPDLDVFGVACGLPNHGPLGHRGFTHSLAFAALIAALAGLLARKIGARTRPTAVLAFVAVASHGILDALTYDSRGTPLFWPLSDARIAFPWRPIPAAPTGLAFLSTRGLEVATIELIYFAPIIACALLWRSGVTGQLSLGCAAFRSGVIGISVMGCLVTAELLLRDTPLVAWLERPSLVRLAVSDAQPMRLTAWRTPRAGQATAVTDGAKARGRRPRNVLQTRPALPTSPPPVMGRPIAPAVAAPIP